MNTRTIEMSYILVNRPKHYSLKSLASRFNVTERMIRKDFESINDFLGFRHAKIEIDENGKVGIIGNRKQITDSLNSISYYDYTLSQNERILVICLLLLLQQKDCYTTLAECADFMAVSRSTVVKDLDEVKNFLSLYKISFVSKSNHGLSIVTDEANIRAFVLSVLINDFNQVVRLFAQENLPMKIDVDIGYVLDNMKDTVVECEKKSKTYLAPDSSIVLVYYLLIAHIRIENGFVAKCKSAFEHSSFLENLVDIIAKKTSNILDDNEKFEISIVLKRLNYLTRNQSNASIIKTQMVTRRFIEKLSRKLHIDLNRNYQFYENLSTHLASIIDNNNERIQEFPEVKELVNQKSWLSDIVRGEVGIIEDIANCKLSEVAIDYIIIYVSVAIEQLKNQVGLDVLVVCNSGIATNQLLRERLKQLFVLKKLVSVSSKEYLEVTKQETFDLAITTVSIDGGELEVIQVSPLLEAKDIEEIRTKVDELRLKSISDYNGDEDIINKMIVNSDDEKRAENKAIVNEFLENSNLEVSPHLSDLLTDDYILMDQEANDWKEAIRVSSKPMLDNADIEECYVDAMIEQIETNGPYVVISKHVAVPHGSYDQGTKKIAMSLVYLKNPVPFGIEEYDPVKIVCVLSPIDQNSHLRAFFTLVNLLLDSSYKNVLLNAKTKSEVMRIINEYERDK